MTIKIPSENINSMETSYPGIKKDIYRFEDAKLPTCSSCGSVDTADVQIGIIGRTICICAATTKFKLIPNGPRPGRYFCNTCNQFFTPLSDVH